MSVRDLLDDTGDWQRLNTLFDAVFEQPPERRQMMLDELAQADPAMARRVREMLTVHEQLESEGFLESIVDAPIVRPTLAGRQFGAYRLTEPLGQGGMGTVWLAERNDGRFQGKAAIKLLHGGLLRPADQERFRREASALARLSHPNIARLIDAGVSEDQQPYLVIEYVSGKRIDEACDAAALDLTSRIRLCVQMLEAVGHAHGRLVLHRDIKPSNVLVDDDGQVKLIDFGVARLVQSDEDSATSIDVTREFGRAFTPRFGAPEQWTGAQVTTATDVYALGLLMYTLLAGANPRDGMAPLSVPEADLPLASRVAAQAGRPDRARDLRGDLDNILARAVKADPAHRYPTADAFADDLRRYLRGDPVSARPDTFGYRLNRFVTRHRVAVAAATAAVLGIATIAGVALVQRREARRQADIAVARGTAAFAVAEAPTRLDRALLLGVEGVRRRLAPETSVGLLTAMDAAQHLVAFRRAADAAKTMVVSPDKQALLTVDADGLVRRWSLPDWKVVAERRTSITRPLYMSYVRNAHIVAAVNDTSAVLLDANTLAPVHEGLDLRTPIPNQTLLLDVTPDGTRAVVGAYYGDTVTILDLSTGTVAATITSKDCGQLYQPSFVPGRSELALACHDGVFIYDLASGALVRQRRNLHLGSVAFSPDGRLLVLIPWDARVTAIDTVTLEDALSVTALPGGRAYSLSFTHDGKAMALGTDSGSVVVWDLIGKREVLRFGGLDEGVMSLEWLEDALTVNADGALEGSGRLLAATLSGLSEWDVTQASAVGTASRPSPLLGLSPLAADQPRGVFYRGVAAGADGSAARLEVVSMTDGQVRHSFPMPGLRVRPTMVSPDGTRVLLSVFKDAAAAEGWDATLVVVDTTNGTVLTTLQLPVGFYVRPKTPPGATPPAGPPGLLSVFSPDNSRLVGWRPGSMYAWHLGTGNLTASVPFDQQMASQSFSPDSRQLVVTRDVGIFSTFDAGTLRLQKTVDVTPFTIHQMYPSTALGGIVMTSEGGEVAVFDAARGEIVGEPFRAGGSQLQQSALSPDNRYLAAASSDGMVRVWDVATRVPIGPPLRGHPRGRAFPYIWFTSPSMLSTFVQGTRIDWNLDVVAAARTACERVGRALTSWEWQQFVGNVPYAPSCRPQAAGGQQ